MSEAVSVERETTDPDSHGNHETKTLRYTPTAIESPPHRMSTSNEWIGARSPIGHRVRLFSGGWRGNGKEGSSADERVPLQPGVLGVD